MLAPNRHHHPIQDSIIAHMMPTVRRIAYQLAKRLPAHVGVNDLIGAGSVGLVAACARFEPGRMDYFEAYAAARIRGAMLDELRVFDPLSRSERSFAKREAASKRVLEHRLGRAPDAAELAEHLELPLSEYWRQATATTLANPCSLDDAANAVEANEEAGGPPDERLAKERSKRAVHAALQALPPRLHKVMELRYARGLTLRQIGALLRVTESRVCQLVAEATRRMRAACAPGAVANVGPRCQLSPGSRRTARVREAFAA